MVQNGKENCHHDHIPFNWKGNKNPVLSVQSKLRCGGKFSGVDGFSDGKAESIYAKKLSADVGLFSFTVSDSAHSLYISV